MQVNVKFSWTGLRLVFLKCIRLIFLNSADVRFVFLEQVYVSFSWTGFRLVFLNLNRPGSEVEFYDIFWYFFLHNFHIFGYNWILILRVVPGIFLIKKLKLRDLWIFWFTIYFMDLQSSFASTSLIVSWQRKTAHLH